MRKTVCQWTGSFPALCDISLVFRCHLGLDPGMAPRLETLAPMGLVRGLASGMIPVFLH